ncbi:hypothetical protein [Dialister invisus]|uniref:hypothetical protein n=1 Tax=Dialister invisus TaxID=218538 RepID=UPI0023F3449F|nr:hypothetical protein [Dialister invisus]MBS6199240.1 hypothetical protein [Dialister invisus]
MNKTQMKQQIKIAKEGIEVLDKWAETLDAEALEEKREQIDKAKAYCEDCLEASQTLIEAIEATEPKKEEKPKRRRAPAKKKEEPVVEPCPPAAAADDLDDLF